MNTTAPDNPTYTELPHGLLLPSPTNPRKTFPATALQELADSIAAHGILQPLVVRPLADARAGQPSHEIVSGERRWRAAAIAHHRAGITPGTGLVPCLVRPLDDMSVLEIQVIENVQRHDLHPLEEAEGLDALLLHASRRPGAAEPRARLRGWTIEDLALRLGKSRSHIYGRLRLLGLVPDARRAYLDGHFGLRDALAVARLQPAAQTELVTALWHDVDRGATWEPGEAAQRAQRHYMLRLHGAPFALADSTLVPSAGSCQHCPKRSGANPELFDDLITEADTCADRACYEAKLDAHHDRILQRARDAGYAIVQGAAARKLLAHEGASAKGYERLDQRCSLALSNKPLRELLPHPLKDVIVVDLGSRIPPVELMPTGATKRKLRALKLLREDEPAAEDRASGRLAGSKADGVAAAGGAGRDDDGDHDADDDAATGHGNAAAAGGDSAAASGGAADAAAKHGAADAAAVDDPSTTTPRRILPGYVDAAPSTAELKDYRGIELAERVRDERHRRIAARARELDEGDLVPWPHLLLRMATCEMIFSAIWFYDVSARNTLATLLQRAGLPVEPWRDILVRLATDGGTAFAERSVLLDRLGALSVSELARLFIGAALSASHLDTQTGASTNTPIYAEILMQRFDVDDVDPPTIDRIAADIDAQLAAECAALGAEPTKPVRASGKAANRPEKRTRQPQQATPPAGEAAKPPAPAAGSAKPADSGARRKPYRYRDPATGDTWSGKGLRPAWIKARLAQGRTLEEFDVAHSPAATAAAPAAPDATQTFLAAHGNGGAETEAAKPALPAPARYALSPEAAWPFPSGDAK